MTEYEQRFVYYIDVLGWSDLSLRSETNTAARERLFEAARAITHVVPKITFKDESAWNVDIRISQISDSLFLSCRPHPSEIAFANAYIVTLHHQLLNSRLLLRGGAALGNAVHTGNQAFGPAVVQAVLREREGRGRPRVLVAQEELRRILRPDEKFEHLFLQEDGDELFLDYFRRPHPSERMQTVGADADERGRVIHMGEDQTADDEHYNFYKNAILLSLKGHEEGSSSSIKEKWDWVFRKFESACVEFGYCERLNREFDNA